MNSAAPFDVAVVGAGPAGTASAIVAHQAGLRVCWIERPKKEGLRPGESLAPAALRALRTLGIRSLADLLDPSEFKICVANVSAWGSDTWIARDAVFNPEGGGFHLLRHRFDDALCAHAQSLGIHRVEAQNLHLHRDRVGESVWRVDVRLPGGSTHSFHSRFLIDASGRSAVLARQLGSARRRDSDQAAVVFWLRHPAADLDDTSRVRSAPNGWWYTARLPQGLRVVAFHGLPADVARLAQSPSQLLAALEEIDLLPVPPDADSLVQPPITADAAVQRSQPAAGEQWLSVGDAALSFDPLSSQGILFALYSGIRGAETAVRLLAQPASDLGLIDEYHASVRRVHEANQRSRRLFYESERRWLDNPYWRAQRATWDPIETSTPN